LALAILIVNIDPSKQRLQKEKYVVKCSATFMGHNRVVVVVEVYGQT
jgi:hypothetical protein